MTLTMSLISCLESAFDIHTTSLEGVGHYVALTSRQKTFVSINATVDQEYYRFVAVWRIEA
jgi:hypothetical protein